MKNILHITTWYPNDYDPQLGIFIKKHVQLGHAFANNIVIAIIPNAQVNRPRVQVTKSENFIEIIGYYRARSGSKWSNYRNYLRIQTLVLQELLKLDWMPDYVHCHVGEKSIAFAQKYFGKVPTFVSEHWSGFLNGTFQTYKAKRQAKRIKEINSCRKLLVVSEALKTALTKEGVTIPIDIIPNIIEQGIIKTSFNETPKFLVVADLVDQIKNVSGIIDAFKNTDISGATLTIIGDGPDHDSLKQEAGEASIEFLGRQDNEWILQNLHQYDILVVNSWTETFSMITAEALLCGLPVVATQCGGPEQFISSGENGWLVKPGDTDQLLEAMQNAVRDLDQMNPEQIINSVKNKLSIQAIQDTFETLYT